LSTCKDKLKRDTRDIGRAEGDIYGTNPRSRGTLCSREPQPEEQKYTAQPGAQTLCQGRQQPDHHRARATPHRRTHNSSTPLVRNSSTKPHHQLTAHNAVASRNDHGMHNMRFEYTDTVSDVEYPNSDTDGSEPSKRIRSRIQSKNISTVLIREVE